jgi:putative membrane protein
MRGLLLRWLVNALALLLTAALLPGIHVRGIFPALVGALLLGVLNAVIRPVLFILTLPINILTLGLFTLVINGLMLEIVAATIKGLDVDSFGWAILGAGVLGLISWAANALIGGRGTIEVIELRRRKDGTWVP